MLRRVLGPLGRAAFSPAGLPTEAVLGLALAPSLIAGLLLFHLAAAEMLLVAVAAGSIAQVAARLAHQSLGVSPVLPALIGVSLIGPGAPLGWVAAVAATGAVLEIARSRWLRPARIEAGLLAYCVLFLAGRGVLGTYLNPGSMRPLGEPIRLWEAYFGGPTTPFDPIKLYVGNVPGPVFATSLLAVAVGAAWLWYARRLSLGVVTGFLVGAALPIWIFHWSPAFQLDSGPTWFAVALLLADRARLPRLALTRPLIGLAAGLCALAPRSQGAGIEMVFLVVAGIQLAIALVEGAGWALVERSRLWQRSRVAGQRVWRGARSLPAGREA